MLKIKIISSYGNEYEFSEEIEIFPEIEKPGGTVYNVSMPTISLILYCIVLLVCYKK